MHTCLSFVRKVDLFVTGFLCTLIIVFISTSTYSLSHILTFLLEIIELRLIFSINSTHSIYTSATYSICFLILYKST